MLNVVIFNGGRGAGVLIQALLNQQGINLTSVVNAYDDGKSTGEIRRFFGMLGPSDIRKVQELMLRTDDDDYLTSKWLFSYRFPVDIQHDEALSLLKPFAFGETNSLMEHTFKNDRLFNSIRACLAEFIKGLNSIETLENRAFDFSDCSIMNCLYAGAFLLFERNIEKATLFFDRLFKLKGTVLPTNNEDKQLVALRENGEILYTEADIVELRSNVKIERIYLLDKLLNPTQFEKLSVVAKRYYLERHHSFVPVSNAVKLAIKQADIVIYSAGTQHSSLYPTYIAAGLAEAIADNSAALKVLLTNIGADYETPSYKASDYIKGAFRYLNMSDSRPYQWSELFDIALVNHVESQKFRENDVVCDFENLKSLPIKIVFDNFEDGKAFGKHNGEKVVTRILSLYDEKQNIVYLS